MRRPLMGESNTTVVPAVLLNTLLFYLIGPRGAASRPTHLPMASSLPAPLFTGVSRDATWDGGPGGVPAVIGRGRGGRQISGQRFQQSGN